MPVYEQLLAGPFEQALHEASMHFEEKSAVHDTLRKLARRLEQISVPYAVAGAMAMFQHGYRRFTEDVDVLVTPEGLRKIQEQLVGLGYRPQFAGSKNLRDAEFGVRIEFLVAGQYPGDGKPKPVAFPDPAAASIERDGIHFLPLRDLVELKLASGMTNRGRLKDLADVQEMIRTLNLPLEFADSLNSYVQDEFRALWRAVQESPPTQPPGP